MSRLTEVVKSLGSAIDGIRDPAFEDFKDLLRGDTPLWTGLEYRKLWKGLFYGLWNLDGEITQLTISKSIANVLTESDVTTETALQFWNGFLMILKEEWIMVDQHRLDKYYSLARSMLNGMFKRLQQTNWSEVGFSVYLEIEVISSLDIMSSLPAHFIEIYVEELKKVCEEEEETSLTQAAWVVLLYPFETVLKSSKRRQQRLKEKIKNLIFFPLLNEEEEVKAIITPETIKALKVVLRFLDLSTFLDLEHQEEDLEINHEAKLIHEKLKTFGDQEMKRKQETERTQQVQKTRKRIKTSKKYSK